MPLYEEKWLKTSPNEHIYTFTWTVADFNRFVIYKDASECIQSPNFVLYDKLWNIKLYLNGEEKSANAQKPSSNVVQSPNIFNFGSPANFNTFSPNIKSDGITPVPHAFVNAFNRSPPGISTSPTNSDSDYVSVHLFGKKNEVSKPQSYLKVKSFFSILKKNAGEKDIEKSDYIIEGSKPYSDADYHWSIPNLIKKDTIMAANSDLLIDGSLKLRFELVVLFEDIHVSSDLKITSTTDEIKEFSCMEKQILEPQFSDVKFVTADGKELPAHKIILATRVPFFQKMFESNMKESTSNIVEINDIEFNVFKEVLRFIYTGKVEDIDAVASDLIKAADKYGIESLKNECAEQICKTMTTENVMKILEVADQSNAESLKNRALLFIKSDIGKIIASDDFETMAVATNPTLLVDILRSFK